MSTTQNSRLFLVLVLGTLSAFGPFVIDLYLPALPLLVNYYQTTPSLTQLSLTSAMIGLSAGQLFVGSLSDKFGRRTPLLISLLLYLLSTVALIFAPTMELFVVLRLLQGLAASGSVVISRAVATDLYEGEEMTRFFGLLMTVNGVAPILSPVLGSVLLGWVSWQGIFVLLAFIGVALLFFCVRLGESHRVENRLQGSVFASFKPLGELFLKWDFMLFVLLQSFAYTGMFAYIAASPFILQTEYGLSAYAFAVCFALNGSMLVLGANLGSRASVVRVLRFVPALIVLVAVYTAVALVFHWGALLTEVGFLLLMLAIGSLTPVVSAQAMEEGRERAGSASAWLGFLPFFAGAVVSPLVGLGDIFTSTSIALVVAGLATFLLAQLALKKVRS